jgi:hypothetical protein
MWNSFLSGFKITSTGYERYPKKWTPLDPESERQIFQLIINIHAPTNNSDAEAKNLFYEEQR